MKEKRHFDAAPILYTIIIIAVLVLSIIGANLCRDLAVGRDGNYKLRSSLSYIQNKISSADEEGGVRIATNDDSTVLYLAEAEGFETRIYLYEGNIVEELSLATSELSPALAQAVCEAETFTVSSEEGGVLKIEIDGLCAYSSVNSKGGVSVEAN